MAVGASTDHEGKPLPVLQASPYDWLYFLLACLSYSEVPWATASQDQTRAESSERDFSLSSGKESNALWREVPLQLQVSISLHHSYRWTLHRASLSDSSHFWSVSPAVPASGIPLLASNHWFVPQHPPPLVAPQALSRRTPMQPVQPLGSFQ